MPGEEAGDAVVVFSVQDHPVFQRRGAHLFLERDVTLSEALCGVEIPISTLDGRSLLVSGITIVVIFRGFWIILLQGEPK